MIDLIQTLFLLLIVVFVLRDRGLRERAFSLYVPGYAKRLEERWERERKARGDAIVHSIVRAYSEKRGV